MHKLQPHLEKLQAAAPQLALSLTHGAGFPDLSPAIAHFREAFDWDVAQKNGRVVPKPGKDDAYDAANRRIKEATDELARIEKHWQEQLRDKSIAFWTPALQTQEPYQLAVSSNVNEDVSNETDTTGAAPRDYRIIRSVFDEAQERFGQCTVDAFASEPTSGK